MMVKNKIISILLLLICVVMITGCTVVEYEKDFVKRLGSITFKNQEEAKKYILSTLKKKYDMDFEILDAEDDNFAEDGSVTMFDMIGMTCCVKGIPDKTFGVMVKNNDNYFFDNYPLTFFENELLAMGDEFFTEKQMIKKYSINIGGGLTGENVIYTKQDSAMEYFEETGGHAEVTVVLQSGYTDEEYAQEIKILYDGLYEIYGDIFLQVAESQQYIFQDSKPKDAQETITAEGKVAVEPGYDLTEADVLASVKYYRENPTKMYAWELTDKDNRKK
jgi:hypothetical protein